MAASRAATPATAPPLTVAKDWLPACRARFAAEGKRYARDLRHQFDRDSGYHLLHWEPVEPDEPLAAALVEIFPGRTWHLYAIVGDRADPEIDLDRWVPRFEEDHVTLTESWQDRSDTYGNLLLARQVGSTVAVIRVDTERSFYDSFGDDPIVALFVDRFKPAIDQCIGQPSPR